MKIVLMLSWRDIKNPKAGGAERHTHMMLRGLQPNIYHIVHFSPLFKGAKRREIIDGIEYIRKGNIFTVIFFAFLFYRKNRGNILVVIDQCNTHRFFTPLWVNRDKRVLYIHQLTVEIWNIVLPGFWGKLGRILEPLMLKIYKKGRVITVSESTKKELINLGFQDDNIVIIHNGVDFEVEPYEHFINDEKKDFVYVGRYAAYKGINDAIKAVGILKARGICTKLYILGKKNEKYIEEVLKPIMEDLGLTFGDEEYCDIIFKGFVDEETKKMIQRNSKALLFPSIREGWGIIVLEAGCMGTPSIVYNSPGCRDAVDQGRAGYLCLNNTPEDLAANMEKVLVDKRGYTEMRRCAYEFSKSFSWDVSQSIFSEFVKKFDK